MQRHTGAHVVVELLESRQLLSASGLGNGAQLDIPAVGTVRTPHHAPSVVNLLGQFAGEVTITGGSTDTITITITSQHGRSVRGTFSQASGAAGSFAGSIARNNVLHLNFRGTNNHSHGTVTATVSSTGNSFSGTFVSIGRHHHSTGTISVARV